MNTNDISRDFVAIDVEYADSEQNICQVGLAVVRDLEIVEKPSWLIQPPDNHYEECCLRVHHITPQDTECSPTFDQVWPEIQPYLVTGELWAHNASSVEQPVLEKNMWQNGFDAGWLDIRDSRDLYRRTDCPSGSGNGLAQCCRALGIAFDAGEHHDASYDAVKCAEIVIAVARGQEPDWTGVPRNGEEQRKADQGRHVLRLGEFREYYREHPSGGEDVYAVLTSTCEGAEEQQIDVFDKGDRMPTDTTGCIDIARLDMSQDNPLRGKKVVVTGAFSISRKEIERAVEAMGAKKVPKPTKNADAVIIGTRNVGFTKLCALEELQASGHRLFRIVGDRDLEALLYGDGRKFFVNAE